jgi:uncharacterized Fe-S cluster-containing radical SAM superfamily protein
MFAKKLQTLIIMIDQLKMIYSVVCVEDFKEAKLKRLEKRLNETE